MPIDQSLKAWRKARQYSISKLADESGLDSHIIEAIETGKLDPPVSFVECLGKGLQIPTPWLYSTPKDIELLLGKFDDGDSVYTKLDSPDPVTEYIIKGSQAERDLYIMLTSLLYHGETKLLRAAEINLKSLLKQAGTTTVPWQNRLPGNFEPPSD